MATKVAPKIGVPKPMRVNIRPEGHQVSIDDVLEIYLKLTLLHYGSLNPPKVPAMLAGSHRLADLKLRGVCLPEVRRQHWL